MAYKRTRKGIPLFGSAKGNVSDGVWKGSLYIYIEKPFARYDVTIGVVGHCRHTHAVLLRKSQVVERIVAMIKEHIEDWPNPESFHEPPK